MGELKTIAIKNLIVWTDNPRIANEQILTEDEAINILIDEVGIKKMKVLAKDIFINGLNPHRQPIVVSNNNGTYNIYDGNRRLSVIKCVLQGDKRFNSVENIIALTLDTKILVYITDIQEALRLIEVEHTGESEGRGQIPWEAFQRDYAFRHNNKEAIYPYAYEVSRICGLRKKSDFKQIPYTDIDTIFSNEIIKSIFKIENDWDFDNVEFIKEVYERLRSVRTHTPYSRFLPRLKIDEELSKFKELLFPDLKEGYRQQSDPRLTLNSKTDHNESVEKNEPLSNNENFGALSEDVGYSNVKSAEPKTKSEKRKNNSYKINPFLLFQWRGKGINIDNAVFKPTLEFAICLQINTDSDLRRFAAYLYRLLLEIALRYWCNWYGSNEVLFNTNAINDYQKIRNCILGTTSTEVSFTSENKIKNIILVLENIKNTTKKSKIKECFKNKSDQSYANMVREFNEIIHGSKEHIDKSVLEKYDEMVLNYLIALSISLSNSE